MRQKTTESLIEEIHRTRREISDRFGQDAFAIAEDAGRRQAASNRPIWKPKGEEQSDATGSGAGSFANRDTSPPAQRGHL
jgi:hypothetical protein